MISNVVEIESMFRDPIRNESLLVESYLNTKRSSGTKRVYGIEIKKFAEFYKKPLVTADVTALMLYNNHLVQVVPNEKTRQRIYSILRNFYSWLLNMHFVKENPTIGPIAKLTPQHTPSERALSKEDLLAMLEVAASNKRDYALLCTLTFTGSRITPLINANWSDIQKGVKGKWELKVISKGNETQYLKVTDTLLDVLKEYAPGHELPNTDTPIFTAYYGGTYKRISSAGVRRIVTKIAKKAGVAHKISPHWFRHGFATIALAGGASLRDVQIALGHKNIATTELYLHGSDNNVADYLGIVI